MPWTDAALERLAQNIGENEAEFISLLRGAAADERAGSAPAYRPAHPVGMAGLLSTSA